jgi:16S rRNA (guanine966-N2)-methyltransferase
MLKIIAGKFKNKKLKQINAKNIRPTPSVVRDAIFNSLQFELENKNFLDLFSGSGAMGLEAISRGCLFSTFIDNNKASINIISQNIKLLNIQDQCSVIPLDVKKALKKLPKAYDIIYIDPPYSYFENPSFIKNLIKDLDNSNALNDEAIVFIEQKYSKESLKNPPSFNNFKHIVSKKYASSILHRYHWIES